MIVSWDWLGEFVRLDMPLDELTLRLTMSGLNLEGTESVGRDTAIDLEVTSNRPDCLGHLGVAREISVLYERELQTPFVAPETADDPVESMTSVEVLCPELCPRYTARVIRGVSVGPSPDWLVERLKTVGITSVNNIVDITNYVLMETGQPLHAFDLDRLSGQRIVVREATKGESLEAINHTSYSLAPGMCVIADDQHPVALAGVMGGAATEISDSTSTILIETAEFDPLSVRNTARTLSLFSDSSFRFERGIDAHGLDRASLRCCELILQLAGGELLDGVIWVGDPAASEPETVSIRFAQVPRILGVEIAPNEIVSILESLGLALVGEPTQDAATFQVPGWRRDLGREIDLIEEVARIWGYDRIPEDARVPMTLSGPTRRDRVLGPLRDLFCAAGFFEAVTISFVTPELFALFQPEPARPQLSVDHSSRRQENLLRQSLVPSLLQSRRENERHGCFGVDLFEIANVYLEAQPGSAGSEPTRVTAVSGRSFAQLKGVCETVTEQLAPQARLSCSPSDLASFVPGRGATISINDTPCGWLGELARDVTDALDLRDAVTIVELDLEQIEQVVELARNFSSLPRFPAIERDLNFLLDDSVTWDQLSATVRDTAGPLLDSVTFGGQYHGKQIPTGKKSYVVTIGYRSADRTLTNDEVEEAQANVVSACDTRLGATLR
ncbi:MAG: phenylalanine--tRNA ligase subunit beta [Planctomycetaceae bacterium]|nr:phenylalanine--tRNA ligase subunit beta [Planctomycetaceae bacterium]